MRERAPLCHVVLLTVALGTASPASAGQQAAAEPDGIAAATAARTPADLPGSWPPLQRLQPGASANVENALPETLAESVDRCVASSLAATGVPGAAVAVLVDGQLAYSKGYGVKHRRNGGEVTAQTTFRIGSITKMMTAAAVLQQIEAGRVSLDDPVTRLVPELSLGGRWPADIVTVRHLLTHTSAIPDLPFDLDGPHDASGMTRWVADHAGTTLHAQPGAFYNYSNPNFILAGLVAERAGGLPYHRLMGEAVWGPAGMTTTTLDPAAVVARGDYSYGHYHDAAGRQLIVAPDAYDNWAVAPAGYAFSTAPDLVRWAALLMDGGAPVLTSASATALEAPQAFMNTTPDQFYGFGVAVFSYKGLDVCEHDGYLAGWGSDLLWVPARRFAVAVLGNGETPLYGATVCVVDAVLEPGDVPPPDLTTDPATWTPYVGSYAMTSSLGDRFEAQVAFQGDDLVLTLLDVDESGPLAFTMRQIAGDLFAIDSNADGLLDLDLTFIHGPSATPRWLRNRSFVGERASTPRQRAP